MGAFYMRTIKLAVQVYCTQIRLYCGQVSLHTKRIPRAAVMRRGFLSFCVLDCVEGMTSTPGSYYNIIAASVSSLCKCKTGTEIQAKTAPACPKS
jgi:hypothetical protein